MANSDATPDGMRMFQVALSSSDAAKSQRWYCEGLGWLPSGLHDHDHSIDAQRKSGELPDDFSLAALQMLPEPVVIPRQAWAVDQQDFFQLEIFEYSSPTPRKHDVRHNPADLGYSLVGIHSADFDAALVRLAQLGSPPISEIVGVDGSRRACVRDPDGAYVELMEDDPRTDSPISRRHLDALSAVRFVRISVIDIKSSLEFFRDTLGLAEIAPDTLHGPEHEQLWSLGGSNPKLAVLSSGDTWIELAEYASDVHRSPAPNRLLSDHGILNIAIGSRRREAYVPVRDGVLAAGYRAGVEASLEFQNCIYVFDRDGTCVELGYMDTEIDQTRGFVPVR